MKLVSKFKDYYDGALAYGRDESVTYVRITKEIGKVDYWKDKDPELVALHEEYWSIPRHFPKDLPNYRVRPECRAIPTGGQRYFSSGSEKGHIAFCGKLYPFVGLQVKNSDPKPFLGEENIWVHSFDKEFDKYVEIIPRWKETSTPWSSWSEWFAESVVDDAALNLHLGSPVVAVDGQTGAVVVNPCLKDMGFQKIVDPYTAFQEISMFISGVLGVIDNKPSNQTDNEKVVSHGFDPKYGFRKPPQT